MRYDEQQEAKIKADLETINKRERNEISKERGIQIDDLDVRDDLDATQNYEPKENRATFGNVT